jgi:hypothetical protein
MADMTPTTVQLQNTITTMTGPEIIDVASTHIIPQPSDTITITDTHQIIEPIQRSLPADDITENNQDYNEDYETESIIEDMIQNYTTVITDCR